MSVTSVSEDRESRSGSKSLNGMRTYTRVYIVMTDDIDDGPKTILASSDLPDIGDYYSAGNDTDRDATLERMTPTRNKDNPKRWAIKCDYATQAPSGGGNNGGSITRGSELDRAEPPTVEITYAHYVEVAQKGRRVKNGRTYDWGAITNSALVPFVDPPIEKDVARTVIRISRFLPSFNANVGSGLVNTINKQTFRISWHGLDAVFFKHELKLQSLSARERIVGTRSYWRVEYELHYGDWAARPLDMGFAAAGLDDDAGDPHAGNTDLAKGIVDRKKLKDVDELTVTDPVLLDGEGGALDVDTLATNAVFLEYQIYKEKNWNNTPIMRDMPHNQL